MYHIRPVSVLLFVLQIIVSITSWVFVIVGPFFKNLNKDFRKEDQENYSQYTITHIGTWTTYKTPEMFVPTFFIPLAMLFPFLGMFLIRNCLKKNLSGVGKIVLLTITVSLYIINGALIHYGIRNISLSRKDTIHIGWLVAAGLNWFAVVLIIFNNIVIYCCEVSQNYKSNNELNSSLCSGGSGLSGSLSGAGTSKLRSSAVSASGSRTTSRSGTKSNLTRKSSISGSSKK